MEQRPGIEVRARTEIVGLEGGEDRLEAVRWRDNRTMAVERRELGRVVVMTGAEPATRWLAGCVALDDKGFIKTGPALSRGALTAAKRPLARAPHLLATIPPRGFAVRAVLHGSPEAGA